MKLRRLSPLLAAAALAGLCANANAALKPGDMCFPTYRQQGLLIANDGTNALDEANM